MPPRKKYHKFPERRRPRLPTEGIKPKNQSGDFAETWWAKRWISVLESFGYGGRLQRGRTYARAGAVLSIDVSAGQVDARVQGSRSQPYKIRIAMPPLSSLQWNEAIDAMSERAIFTARLLDGEMPQEIEEAFSAAGVPLFPRHARDIVTSCTCPDAANPCKHIVAVHYLLGERFDEDPFLLFQLRGRSQSQIVEALRKRRADASAGSAPPPPPPKAERVPSLSEQLDRYDQAGDLDKINIHIDAPEMELAILRRYGSAPAGVDAELRATYRLMSRSTMRRMFDE